MKKLKQREYGNLARIHFLAYLSSFSSQSALIYGSWHLLLPLHSLTRVFSPSPQLLEHWDHSLHWRQPEGHCCVWQACCSQNSPSEQPPSPGFPPMHWRVRNCSPPSQLLEHSPQLAQDAHPKNITSKFYNENYLIFHTEIWSKRLCLDKTRTFLEKCWGEA